MPPKKKLKETRSDTDIFLVGQPKDKPSSMTKPLTNGDMVRYMHYRKNLDWNKSTNWDNLFSCALMSGTTSASCSSKGCRTGEGQDLCGVAFARCTGRWDSTGIPLKSDRSLKIQISNLFKDWQVMNKLRTRLSKATLSPKDQILVDNFVHKMNQTFLAAIPNAEEIIMKDKLRDSQQKEEDICFLKSMKEDRVASVSGVDKVYQKRVDDKTVRLDNEKVRLEKYKEGKKAKDREENNNDEDKDIDEDDSDDDFVPEDKSKKQKKRESRRADTVTIQLPRNIVQVLAPTASRYDVSHTALSSLLLQTVAAGGGDIDSLPLSRRQVERNSKVSVTEYAAGVREAFVISARGKKFICHFDGKQLLEFTMGVKATKERMTVAVSSPDMQHPQVLGSMPLDGQTGEDISGGVLYLLKLYQIDDKIVGLSFDTTASNTGPAIGACIRLETHLSKGLLWLGCRRHVMELHIKHVAKMVAKDVAGRKPTGPVEPLFKKLQDNWPALLPVIDMNSLKKFDWQAVAGTELEAQAQSSLEILSNFLKSGTFPREDYRELCELTVLYLGGAVPKFRFQYPGAYHHARYMAKAIYMLKLMVLMEKITWLEQGEKMEVKIMADFISVFYAVWWLKAYLAVEAPMNDLKAFQQMRMLKKHNQKVADTCLASWRRHTWYLTEELVVICLADTKCPYREEVAAALLQQEVLDEFPPKKPQLPQLEEQIWPSNGELPSLAEFVGPKSRLMFSLLQFSPAELDWLQFSCDQWDRFSGYQRFSQFVKKLAVVNDAGERGVKAIQEVVGRTTLEPLRQDMMVTHSEERKLFPNRGSGQESKSKLAKI